MHGEKDKVIQMRVIPFFCRKKCFFIWFNLKIALNSSRKKTGQEYFLALGNQNIFLAKLFYIPKATAIQKTEEPNKFQNILSRLDHWKHLLLKRRIILRLYCNKHKVLNQTTLLTSNP